MRKMLDPVIQNMRNLFEHSFDRAWFYSMLNNVPLELKEIREIRDFLTSESTQRFDLNELAQKAGIIDTFLDVVDNYMIPELKEKLGISYLSPGNMVEDKDEFVTRQFIAYTLPHNLKEFAKLNEEYKRLLAQGLEDKLSVAPAM
ncbi:MAG: hypothetical protein JW904_05905 [Spirochaetales bacterium]|nr:hypothetical protein [Spirochaetales bacterium]